MKTGITVEKVFSAERTMTAAYSATVMKDTTDSYSKDFSVDIHLTCTGTDGVGLWQWVTESNDGASRVLSEHSVCRYGADAFTSPDCPWNACLNGDCTECADDWYV